MNPWPRAAVFDCDGLLVDSAACWEDAYAELAGRAGRTLESLDLAALTGASVRIAALRLSRDLDHEVDQDALRDALRASFAARPLHALPGARALVRTLARRFPLAVASNAPREIVEQVLERLELRAAFDAVVSAEETAADKPAPDVYLEACRRLGAHPSDAIAFEDSPLGAHAARRAGLMVIGVPSMPGLHLDVDLVVPQLDDPRLLTLLQLEHGTPT